MQEEKEANNIIDKYDSLFSEIAEIREEIKDLRKIILVKLESMKSESLSEYNNKSPILPTKSRLDTSLSNEYQLLRREISESKQEIKKLQEIISARLVSNSSLAEPNNGNNAPLTKPKSHVFRNFIIILFSALPFIGLCIGYILYFMYR